MFLSLPLKSTSMSSDEEIHTYTHINRATISDPAIALWGIYLKELETGSQREYWDTRVHISSIHKGQKMETTQVPTNRGADRENMVYVMDYCSALKRNEILTQATTWVNLADIASGISQSHSTNTV